jgi:hypothetical protein
MFKNENETFGTGEDSYFLRGTEKASKCDVFDLIYS